MKTSKRFGICAGLTLAYLFVGCLTGLGIVALMPGCATITPTTSGASVCDSVPEGETSAICTLAKKLGKTPEEISKGIQVANLAGLSVPYYTALEAKEYLDNIKEAIQKAWDSDATITLDQVFEEAQKRWKFLSPETQALISILNPVDLKSYGIKLNMIDKDFEFLMMGIDEQYEVITPFLK